MATHETAVPFKQIQRYGSLYGGAGIVLQELVGLSIVQVAAFPGTEAQMFKALEAELDLAVDGTNGKCTVNGDGKISAVWMGLNSYLIVGEGLADGELYDALASKLADCALVTDQSAGRAAFELKGHSVVQLMMSEAATNLEEEVFGVGESRAISWAGISAVLWYRENKDTNTPIYVVMPNRSFAQSLWEEMCDVGTEWSVQVIG